MGNNKVKVVRVTQTEFKLLDGRVYQHPIELEPDEVPTVKEFQDYYNHWLSLLDKWNDREIVNNG